MIAAIAAILLSAISAAPARTGAEECYTLTVSADPLAGATANASAAPNCNGGYSAGTTVPIAAVANPGHVFVRWSSVGCVVSEPYSPRTTCRIMGSGAATVTAYLEPCCPPSRPHRVRADFDGNGVSDIWWWNLATGANSIWNISPQAGLIGGTTPPPVPYTVVFRGVGDFNNDGSADVLWHQCADARLVSVWFMVDGTLTGGLSLATVVSAPTEWVSTAGVGDFNGDGYSDILWRNATTGANSIWYITAEGFIGGANLPSVSAVDLKVAAVGDFNNDGRADILWRNVRTRTLIIWMMNGGSIIRGSTLTASDSLRVIGTGDFNGDGSLDLLMRNPHARHPASVIWFISNGVKTGQVILDVLPRALEVGGVGDFNADGYDDIVWRNTSTGTNSIWFITPSGFHGDGVGLPTIPTTLIITAPR